MKAIAKIIGTLQTFLKSPSGRNMLIKNYLIEHDEEAFTASELRKCVYTNTKNDEELADHCFGDGGPFAVGDVLELKPEEYLRERSPFNRYHTSADGTPFVVMENTETWTSTFIFLLGEGCIFRLAIYNVGHALEKGDIRLFRSCKDCCYCLRPDFGNIKSIAASIWEKQGIIDARRNAETQRRIQEAKDEEEKRKRERSAFYY